MTQEEFLDLLWQHEALLLHLDYLRGRVGNCGKPCKGLDAETDEDLCPDCCDWFAQILAEEERLSKDSQYNDIMGRLERACFQDKSGTYQRLLEHSRRDKILH